MKNLHNDNVTIELYLHTSGEQVWKAWTDPTLILIWFGSDPNGKGLKADLDVRPGGSYEITFEDSDQTRHTCSGTYSQVQQFSKLCFTWAWKSEPGVESLVTITLTPAGNTTHMLFEHAGVGTTSRHDYLKGWQTTFAKLERMLMNK